MPSSSTSRAALRASAVVARASSWASARILSASRLGGLERLGEQARALGLGLPRGPAAWRGRSPPASEPGRLGAGRRDDLGGLLPRRPGRGSPRRGRPRRCGRGRAARPRARICSAACSAACDDLADLCGCVHARARVDRGRPAPQERRQPTSLRTRMAEHRYDPAGDRAALAAGVGRRAHLGGLQRRRDGRDSPTCSRCCPYPSGEPHIGHLKVYSVGDAVAHFHRRSGRRVLHPMGYDAFGLPAENHAIKTGQHPRDSTDAAIAEFQRQFRALGHLDRLDARVRHPRAALLPLDPVDLPAALQRRPRLPQGGGGQVVSQRRRPCWPTSRSSTAAASAAAPRSRCASSSSGSSASPTTPTGCSTTSTRSSGPSTSRRCSATGSAAPRAPRSRSAARSSSIDYPVFTTRPDTLFGATFFVMAPEHPDVLRLAAGTEHEQAVRDYVNHAANESVEERGDVDKPKTGVPLGPHRDQPGQRRAAADVRRRLRADGVRHRRDHGRARPRRARLRVRRGLRPADPPRRRRPGGRRAALRGRRAARQLRTRTSTACTTARR